jgi:hypothetical protein
MQSSKHRFVKWPWVWPVCVAILAAAPAAWSAAPAPPRYGATADGGETDDPQVDAARYAGTVYYIGCSASADDGNDGRSPQRAWRSLAQVNKHTEVGYWDTVPGQGKPAPLVAAPSGSAFLFERGCSFEGHINIHALQRGKSQPPAYSADFTFGAYGERSKPRPRIVTTASTERFRATLWSNGHAVHLRNLHLVGDPALGKPGIWLRKSRGSSVVNTVIENMAGDGIHAGESQDLLIRNSVIRNTQLAGKPGGGVTGSGRNLRILQSTLVDNGRHRILAHNIYLSSLEGSLIQGNHIEGGSNLGIVLHGTCEDVQILDNDIFGNSNGIDLSGGYPSKVEGFTRMTIERNRIHHNGFRPNEQGYGLLLKSVVRSALRNNLVYANRVGPMVLADGNPGDPPSAQLTIEHNVFQSPGRGPTFTGAALSEITFRNNIVVALASEGHALMKSAATPDQALVLQSNVYHAPKLPRDRQLRWGTEERALPDRDVNPGFVGADAGDFRLRPDSPARRAGVTTGATTDFAGQKRHTERPSIGAFE